MTVAKDALCFPLLSIYYLHDFYNVNKASITFKPNACGGNESSLRILRIKVHNVKARRFGNVITMKMCHININKQRPRGLWVNKTDQAWHAYRKRVIPAVYKAKEM